MNLNQHKNACMMIIDQLLAIAKLAAFANTNGLKTWGRGSLLAIQQNQQIFRLPQTARANWFRSKLPARKNQGSHIIQLPVAVNICNWFRHNI